MAGMAPQKPCPTSPPFKPLKNLSTQPINTSNMKELALQELELLEAHHPTRFHYLKLQLKEFIHLLDQEHQQPHHFYPSIITQESSSSRKRQREREQDDGCSKRKPKIGRGTRGEGGIRDAIHRAEACLHKIQTLKSFFCSSRH